MAPSFFATTLGKMKRHPDILPLFGFYTLAGGMGIFIMLYTSLRKTDVRFNRWSKLAPEQRVDWTKPTQKLIIPSSVEASNFQPQFSEEKKLLNMIYGDGKYKM